MILRNRAGHGASPITSTADAPARSTLYKFSRRRSFVRHVRTDSSGGIWRRPASARQARASVYSRTRTCAEEIKSIRASGLVPSAINWRTAARFLLEDRFDDTNETFYEGIEHVPPGTAFEVDLNGMTKEWRYRSLEAPDKAAAGAPARFAALFEDAVRLHMRSDVPVGVDLSGGLDSTSIICSTARLRREQSATGPLMAFCYQAPEFDESTCISDTVRQTGAVLVNLKTSAQSLWDDLTRMLWYQDEPVPGRQVGIPSPRSAGSVTSCASLSSTSSTAGPRASAASATRRPSCGMPSDIGSERWTWRRVSSAWPSSRPGAGSRESATQSRHTRAQTERRLPC
jgi:hypothetical protein